VRVRVSVRARARVRVRPHDSALSCACINTAALFIMSCLRSLSIRKDFSSDLINNISILSSLIRITCQIPLKTIKIKEITIANQPYF
jgi:hypothetical protein